MRSSGNDLAVLLPTARSEQKDFSPLDRRHRRRLRFLGARRNHHTIALHEPRDVGPRLTDLAAQSFNDRVCKRLHVSPQNQVRRRQPAENVINGGQHLGDCGGKLVGNAVERGGLDR
jgi:hypothetical protein